MFGLNFTIFMKIPNKHNKIGKDDKAPSDYFFYAPLHQYEETDLTGKPITYYGYDFSTFGGINAFNCNGQNYFKILDNLPYVNHSFTISVWFSQQLQVTDPLRNSIFYTGNNVSHVCFYCQNNTMMCTHDSGFGGYEDSYHLGFLKRWHNLVLIQKFLDETPIKFYIDGKFVSELTYQDPITRLVTSIGNSVYQGLNQIFKGLISNVKVYKRALPEEEIEQLYRLLTPKYSIYAEDQTLLFTPEETILPIYFSTDLSQTAKAEVTCELVNNPPFRCRIYRITDTNDFALGIDDTITEEAQYNLQLRMHAKLNTNTKYINKIINLTIKFKP